MNIEAKKIYYYVLCSLAFFALMWGGIDFTSSAIGLINVNRPSVGAPSSSGIETASSLPDKSSEQQLDIYYQKKMLGDRLWDSVARIVISGAIFAYCRIQAKKAEEKA
jgi:hypothetical protein